MNIFVKIITYKNLSIFTSLRWWYTIK